MKCAYTGKVYKDGHEALMGMTKCCHHDENAVCVWKDKQKRCPKYIEGNITVIQEVSMPQVIKDIESVLGLPSKCFKGNNSCSATTAKIQMETFDKKMKGAT